MRARVRALIAAVLGCAVATHAQAAKLTVSNYGRIVASLPWAVALEKGMFKEAGIDVDGITAGAGGGTSVRNMLAGELPYAEVATSAAIAAVNAGVPLIAVDTASNHVGELAWATRPASGVMSIRDLAGKRVAFTNPKSTTEMILRTALAKEGLAGKVDILALGGLGPALTALSQDAVAAAPLNDPAMTLTPDKYRILFYAHQYVPKFSWQVGVTTKEFAQKNPDELRSLVKVHRRAVDFVYANRDEAARIYSKIWEVSLAEAKAILPKYYEWEHWSRGDFSKEGLDAFSEGLVTVGELTKPFDWPRLIEPKYLDDDLRRGQ